MTTNRSLQRLQQVGVDSGCPVQFIGPVSASEFLTKIHTSLGLDEPLRVPFGINPHSENPRTLYSSKLGHRRQYAPVEGSAEQDELSSGVVSRVESLLEEGKAVYLTGDERTGKMKVLAEIAKIRPPERVFYFSPLFARQPVAQSFRSDLRQVAAGVGIDTLSIRSWQELYASVLAEGVTLLLDDVVSSGIGSDRQLIFEIGTVLTIQKELGTGSLIVASELPRDVFIASLEKELFRKPVAWTGPSSRDVFIASLEKELFRKPVAWTGPSSRDVFIASLGNHLKNLDIVRIERALEEEWRQAYRDEIRRWLAEVDSDTRAVVGALSRLKSGIDVRFVRKLSGVASARAVLDKADKQGFLERRGTHCRLRQAVWTHARESLELGIGRLRELAERVLEIQRQSYHADVLHFALEAESLLWEARDVEQALEVALTLAGSANDPVNARFYLSTLQDFGDAILTGDVEIEQLPPEQLSDLLFAIVKLSRWSAQEFIIETPQFRELASKINGRLSVAERAYLVAKRESLDGEWQRSCDRLTSILSTLEGKSQESLRGNAALLLSACWDEIAKMKETDDGRLAALAELARWAQEAERSFQASGDATHSRWARDNRVSALVAFKRFDEAIAAIEEYRSEHVVDPGFNEGKAVMYGNMFAAKLGLGSIDESEGYYFEAQTNNIFLGRWEGIFQNLENLFAFSLDSENSLGLPRAIDIYRHLMGLGARQPWIGDIDLTLRLFKVNGAWFRACRELRASDLAREAFKDFVALGRLYDVQGLEDELFRRARLLVADIETREERERFAAWLQPLLNEWPTVVSRVDGLVATGGQDGGCHG